MKKPLQTLQVLWKKSIILKTELSVKYFHLKKPAPNGKIY